ncbi:MAG: tetratricopeptide repeat protein [Terriglobia bacterium]
MQILKGALFLFVLVMVILGARVLGSDIAAETYYVTAQKKFDGGDIRIAYSDALRAVRRRPAELRYWQILERAKVSGRQYTSALEDEPRLRALGGGQLDPDDALRFVTCRYELGQDQEVVKLTRKIIQKNRFYPRAYLLEGVAYVALKQYGAAENTLLALLNLFPTQVDGVAELAQAYYLAGNAPRALAVLEATNHYPFPRQARARFEALKVLYAQ